MRTSHPSAEFCAMCVALGVGSELANKTATSLIAAYNEPQRGYHNLFHISNMLETLSTLSEPRDQLREVLQFAIWFHDVTYDPIKGAPYNENQSIVTWQKFAQRASPHVNEYDNRVVCLIKATIHHDIPLTVEIPDNLPIAIISQFLDLYLAILASPTNVYDEYANNIRQEYIHVPQEIYRKSRSKLLQNFLKRDRLFLSNDQEAEEMKAKSNLRSEIATLENH